ncbi:FHA domain-containing protein [Streptomyces poonensis]|nr:FHA domain-containing protein [Streptomyces poonensis]
MQIRLTVVDPLGPPSEPRGHATACDVLVTAPSGTALAAVAPGLASAVGGSGGGHGASPSERGRESAGGPVVLYAGAERLDAQRCTLGEPPLIDGAVLSLGAPAEPASEVDESAPRLHVVAGPDAGGVHFLHGGRIRVGRSDDADVPLDDPDVSRLHCTVTVVDDGRVWVADLGSTNGTALDGTRVGDRPVRFPPGSLLRIGESALRLAPPGAARALETTPDGEGQVRVVAPGRSPGASASQGSAEILLSGNLSGQSSGQSSENSVESSSGSPSRTTPRTGARAGAAGPGGSAAGAGAGTHPGAVPHARVGDGDEAYGSRASAPAEACGHASGSATFGPDHGADVTAAGGGEHAADDGVPGPGGTRKGTPVRGTDVPRVSRKRGGLSAWARRLTGGRADRTAGGHDPYDVDENLSPRPSVAPAQSPERWPDPAALLLTALGPGQRLWERTPGHPELLTVRLGTADRTAPDGSGLLPAVPVTTGLREVGALGLAGPRPRLAGLARAVVAQLAALHSPDLLELVLISADRARPVAERTAEWAWLGWLPHVRPGHGQDCRLLLAYDRDQAAARMDELLRRLEDHATDTAAADGTLPETAGVRGMPVVPASTAPGEGTTGSYGSAGNGSAGDAPGGPASRRPSWRRDGGPAGHGSPEAYTVVLVDGDPGGADVRESVTRLALEGPSAGIHVICLAETDAASPASPVTETYEAACAVSPVFRACGAVALLSGDVATALRLMRAAPARPTTRHTGGMAPSRQATSTGHTRADSDSRPDSGPRPVSDSRGTGGSHEHREDRAGSGSGTKQTHTHTGAGRTSRTHVGLAAHPPAGAAAGAPAGPPDDDAHPGTPVTSGTVAAVDAVSAEWAERFARALAPLRPDGASGGQHPRVSAPLPQSARLLDELGLARATPASLLARWADAADDTSAVGGRAWAVLGAGPRGPVCADLGADGPHLLIEGPPGSGRTELLRSVAASLAAAERPDRLGIVLVDGEDGGGHGRHPGDGLGACTDLPHVATHLTANDPVRMREFAQSLSAELKRRAELLGRLGFTEWHTSRAVTGRLVAQRTAGVSRGTPSGAPAAASGADDLDTPPTTTTVRLRPAAGRERPEPGPPLARLVVIVDDLDALLSPPLGSPGRPAAGSVVRALEAAAREGAQLGVHLVASTSGGTRTAGTDLARAATLRVVLETPATGPDEPVAGRGQLTITDTSRTASVPLGTAPTTAPPTTAPPTGHPDGSATGSAAAPARTTPFQAGRVTGRIPRTATLRPTVVPLEWARMGDPPARRPVRELGNGPTDLALLASALDRAARSVSAKEVPSLL